MAKATDTPIYRAAYELLILIVRLTGQYPRNFRQGLARDINVEAQAVVTFIFRANCSRDKAPILERLRDRLETLRLQLRLSKDLHLISAAQFGATVQLMDSVGKQLAGWTKYAKGQA